MAKKLSLEKQIELLEIAANETWLTYEASDADDKGALKYKESYQYLNELIQKLQKRLIKPEINGERKSH